MFGFNSGFKDSLSYLEDGSYVYPVGASVVIAAADGRTHRFVPGSVECEGITALALSPNKKLLAVAERADKAVISVYDMQTLKRRKQLVAADVGSKVRSVPERPPGTAAQDVCAAPRMCRSTSACASAPTASCCWRKGAAPTGACCCGRGRRAGWRAVCAAPTCRAAPWCR